MSKKVLILQSNYIPWKGYFDAINMVDEFVIYDHVQYTRKDWRNRNKIKTPKGVNWLNVPVDVTGKFELKLAINQVEVSDLNWGEQHWETIKQFYTDAPFFNLYADVFKALYSNKEERFLSKINYAFITEICKILDIKTRITWSTDYTLIEGKTEKLVDICKQLGATDYYSGPAAKDYLEEHLFTDAGINVQYLDYSGYPVYHQLYGAFEHAVTILDLLFNEGPEAKKFMKSFNS